MVTSWELKDMSGETSTLVGDASLLSSLPHTGFHSCVKHKNQRQNYSILRRIVTLTSVNKKGQYSLIYKFWVIKQAPLFSEEGVAGVFFAGVP